MKSEELIKEFMFKSPEKWTHLREIARQVKLSQNTVKKVLEKNKKIFQRKNEVNQIKYRCNLDFPEYLFEKKMWNLKSLEKSQLIKNIEKELLSEGIILFGSYSRGEDISTSDIDLAIISSKKKKINLNSFEKKLFRTINPSIFTYKDISKEFYTNLINGIILKGRLKYERF